RNHARRRGPEAEREGRARHVRRRQAHGDRRPVHRNEGAGRRLLALAVQVDGRGHRMGEALPGSDAGRGSGDRDPPAVRGGRFRRGVHAGAARAGGARARAIRAAREGEPLMRDSTEAVAPAVEIGVVVDRIYRNESRRIFATLIRLLGDFDVAEEALHEAFRAALEHWPRDGVPANPRAWLVSTGRFKAIDGIRRRSRFDSLEDRVDEVEAIVDESIDFDGEGIADDRLRLIFTCCHPALAADAQVALTLREVCGLTTEQIAQAFLTPVPTLAQR